MNPERPGAWDPSVLLIVTAQRCGTGPGGYVSVRGEDPDHWLLSWGGRRCPTDDALEAALGTTYKLLQHLGFEVQLGHTVDCDLDEDCSCFAARIGALS